MEVAIRRIATAGVGMGGIHNVEHQMMHESEVRHPNPLPRKRFHLNPQNLPR